MSQKQTREMIHCFFQICPSWLGPEIRPEGLGSSKTAGAWIHSVSRSSDFSMAQTQGLNQYITAKPSLQGRVWTEGKTGPVWQCPGAVDPSWSCDGSNCALRNSIKSHRCHFPREQACHPLQPILAKSWALHGDVQGAA